MATLTVGTNSWVTIEEANDYFESRFGAQESWMDLNDLQKTAALITAYKQIAQSGLFSVEASVSATDNEKDAQCEQAIFIVQHQEDADARLGLQAQGVTEAGIVKEKYDTSKTNGIVISPIVETILDDLKTKNSNLYVGALEVDETEDVE